MTSPIAVLVDRLQQQSIDFQGLVSAELFAEAADEIKRLQSECQKLAALLMSEWVFSHERIIEQVDAALKPYYGRANSETRQ